MGRYTRDEIVSQALDLAACPTLSKEDMPGGIVQPNARSVKWLQNALDYFHRRFPFASDIQDVSLLLQAGTVDAVLQSDPTLFLPTDFILDVRDGIDVFTPDGVFYPIPRRDYRTWRVYNQSTQQADTNRASLYTILNSRIKVLPRLNTNVSATLHYYALPPVLETDSPVPFPDEFILIEFIRLKALEWVRSPIIEQGAAQGYLTRALAGLRASGLLHEPEHEQGVPIENNQVIIDGVIPNRNAWMGNYAL